MTTQMLLKEQTVSGWNELFPQTTETCISSTIFVKKLTTLVFSSITYMRNIFPDNAYSEKELGGRKLKVLTCSYSNKSAYAMMKWLEGAFEALERRYMKLLIFEIMDQKKMPLEYYTIEYSYSDEEIACSLICGKDGKKKNVNFDKDKLQVETKLLINKLLNITENLNPLPSEYYLRLRIEYNNNAPDDYCPKYFITQSAVDLNTLPEIEKQNVGKLVTPFHTIQIESGSSLKPKNYTGNEIFLDPLIEENLTKQSIPMELTPVIDNTITQDSLKKSQTEVHACPTASQQTVSENISGTSMNVDMEVTEYKTNIIDSQISEHDNGKSRKTENINCVCTSQLMYADIFECSYCGSWQHNICYKLKPCSKQPRNACWTCAKLNTDLKCIDPTFLHFNSQQIKELAIYRQMLHKCYDNKTINVKTLKNNFQIPSTEMNVVIKKLAQEGFITRSKKTVGLYTVNTKHVQLHLDDYFQEG